MWVVCICDSLITVANIENSSVSINRSNLFHEREMKFELMFSNIDTVTVEPKKREASLAFSRYVVDVLRNTIASSKSNEVSNLYGCKLGSKYLLPNSEPITDPSFESEWLRFKMGTITCLLKWKR